MEGDVPHAASGEAAAPARCRGALLRQEGSEEQGGDGGGTREAEHGAGAVSTHPKENGPPRGFLSTAPA